LGDSAGVGLEGGTYRVRLEAASVEGEGGPPAPRELCAPPGLGGFKDPSTVFSMLGVRGLFAFGDLPLRTLCVEEPGLMPHGTLHGGSPVKN
jgi:hypothetical protein